jgi:hypothetical protein
MLGVYDMLSAEDRTKIIEYELVKIESGLGWANSELSQKRKTSPLYCPPGNLALTGAQLVDILRRARDDDPSAGKQYAGLALLRALERVFPCPSHSN